MKTIETTLLKQSTINLALVALLSLLTACATTASHNAETQTASPSPTVTRDYTPRDLGARNYLGTSRGPGLSTSEIIAAKRLTNHGCLPLLGSQIRQPPLSGDSSVNLF